MTPYLWCRKNFEQQSHHKIVLKSIWNRILYKASTIYILRRHLSSRFCSLVANVSNWSALSGHDVRSYLWRNQTAWQLDRALTIESQHYFLPKETFFWLYFITQIVQTLSKHSSPCFTRFSLPHTFSSWIACLNPLV